MSKFNASSAERPLRTGFRKRTRANRFLDRHALRFEAGLLERLGLPSEKLFRKTGHKKPYKKASCPGEWRYFTVRTVKNSEETLVVNLSARTCTEASGKISALGVTPLEVRQQPGFFGQENLADLWWDRIVI